MVTLDADSRLTKSMWKSRSSGELFTKSWEHQENQKLMRKTHLTSRIGCTKTRTNRASPHVIGWFTRYHRFKRGISHVKRCYGVTQTQVCITTWHHMLCSATDKCVDHHMCGPPYVRLFHMWSMSIGPIHKSWLPQGKYRWISHIHDYVVTRTQAYITTWHHMLCGATNKCVAHHMSGYFRCDQCQLDQYTSHDCYKEKT